ncbi:MAG TPA: hypothetical protein VFA78_09885 [Chloroflexota bacterium]|nr:hypothetical protein [Chloroflexota bacterium]
MALPDQVTLAPMRQDTTPGPLRYLQALTHRFDAGGEEVACVLVYAEPDPDHDGILRPAIAADTGFEGIACLDDTARAATLALHVYRETGDEAALDLARGWLSFVLYMQYPDGRFGNFIRNAAGVRNLSGATSHPGGHPWTLRALIALATAYHLTGDDRYLESYLATPHLELTDYRELAMQALAEIELWRADGEPALRDQILDRARAIADTGGIPYFPAHRGHKSLYLWGYHQLQAVAIAARLFDARDLIEPCVSTVRALVEPDVRARFWHSYPRKSKRNVCAYDVAPMVQGLEALFDTTGKSAYRRLALEAAAWFYGRNDARTTMYDPTTGRCRDGITDGIASRNFGAESSIEAGFAEMTRRRLAPE